MFYTLQVYADVNVFEGIYEGILIVVSYISSLFSAIYNGFLLFVDSLNLLTVFDIYMPSVLASACGISIAVLFIRFLLLK